MSLKKRFKNSLFAKVGKEIKSAPAAFSMMVMLDFLFLFSLIIFNKLMRFLIPSSPDAFIKSFASPWLALSMGLFLMVFYYLMLVLLYSFFSCCIIKLIYKTFDKKNISFKTLPKFFLLNLTIALMLFAAIMIILILIPMLIAQKTAMAVVIVILAAVIAFFGYPFCIAAQLMFFTEKKIKATVAKSFRFVFLRFKKYSPVYLWSLLIVIAYLILSLIVGLILKFISFGNADVLSKIASVYDPIFIGVTTVLLVCMLVFNRIYVYFIVKQKI